MLEKERTAPWALKTVSWQYELFFPSSQVSATTMKQPHRPLQQCPSMPNIKLPAPSGPIPRRRRARARSMLDARSMESAIERKNPSWLQSPIDAQELKLHTIQGGPWLELHRHFVLYVLHLYDSPWNEIARLSEKWAEWDYLTSLANYRFVDQILFGYLMKSSTLSSASAIDVCVYLSWDMSAVLLRIDRILSDRATYGHLLSCRGTVAQQLLDLLQDLLDSSRELKSRASLFKALMRLSGECGMHPTCFTLEVKKVGQQVAGGGFGDIWKGLVGGRNVAVKCMRQFREDDVKVCLKKLGREALIWRQLSHSNLLPFFGLYVLDGRPCLISPWMENGDLKHFLSRAPSDTNRVSLIADVAMGLEYLHSEHVVHGDLKTPNILVTPSGRACITDFGLSTIVDELSLKMTFSSRNGLVGTVRYQAPELLNKSPIHYGSDVYAFACVSYEILTNKVPFFEITNDVTVLLQVVQGLRPSRLEVISPDFWLLLEDCWHQQAGKRPTTMAISQRLSRQAISGVMKQSPPDWDDAYSAKFRRSTQEWPLFPSIAEVEQRLPSSTVIGDHTGSVVHEFKVPTSILSHSASPSPSPSAASSSKQPLEITPAPPHAPPHEVTETPDADGEEPQVKKEAEAAKEAGKDPSTLTHSASFPSPSPSAASSSEQPPEITPAPPHEDTETLDIDEEPQVKEAEAAKEAGKDPSTLTHSASFPSPSPSAGSSSEQPPEITPALLHVPPHEVTETPDVDEEPQVKEEAKATKEAKAVKEAKAAKEAEAANKAGNEACKKRDFEEAATQFSKAWDLWPQDITFLMNLGAVYLRKREYDKAIKVCKKAIEAGQSLRSDYKVIAKAYGRVGFSFQKKGDYASAIEYFQKSLITHRTPDILNKQKVVERIKADIDREKSVAAREEGDVQFKAGDFANAVKGIKRDPNHARGYNNRAAALPKALKDVNHPIFSEPPMGREQNKRKQEISKMEMRYQQALFTEDAGTEWTSKGVRRNPKAVQILQQAETNPRWAIYLPN
ncbi:hypothetical protein C8R45DRAFT_959829 [Mycena sanguinolenta]|nr:hypothetical protein C8R45DRAFT_959829 [Mycena sanguinolenta]